jgi:hypothetical protein
LFGRDLIDSATGANPDLIYQFERQLGDDAIGGVRD